ncbi:MAG: fibrobacter succinogenes major paralogous domain-containing protein [Bacteroidota bacterium]|nr:fibrobacter succinogenes major paralogous domain-containing protein [Bacteroidota bacterium]
MKKNLLIFAAFNIGYQVWMAENLNVEKFRNGDPIPHAKTREEWEKARGNKEPAWCYYDNDPVNGVWYGKLYNWYAVNDPRGLAPEGWHVPSDDEWTKLTDYLEGEDNAGGKLKQTGIKHWNSPNLNIPHLKTASPNYIATNFRVTNETGFTALPGGSRNDYGYFNSIGYNGRWWSATATEYSDSNACFRCMSYSYSSVSRHDLNKACGLSVRCLRD